jgi:hypothetical protein
MFKVQPTARVATIAMVAAMAAVIWCGPALATTVHVNDQQKATGTVSSVNGTGASGTCGTASTPGSFTVTSGGNQAAVDVGATTTTFKEHGVSAPSFGNVCAGDTVRALGALSTDGTLTATTVTVVPPRLRSASGTVTSVNGTATGGTCGVTGVPGEFVVASPSATVPVDAGTATRFVERGVTAPSFADLCVGETVRALGALSNGVLTAIAVTIIPPVEKISGTVASVNGTATPGTCGSAGSDGAFTVASPSSTVPVQVGATMTNFRERGVGTPSFADVCVNAAVRAVGPLVNGIVSATMVTVIPPRPQSVSGIVDSINGTSMAGTCGMAGGNGVFTVTSGGTRSTVAVGPQTIFRERGVSMPSFADVCVGGKVRALGTLTTSGAIAAAVVTVIPPRPQRASGTVASVDGSATCGRSGMAGDFILTSGNNQYAVDVTPTNTIFKKQGVSAPSFATVCTGDTVRTVGSISPTGTFTAYSVWVLVPEK